MFALSFKPEVYDEIKVAYDWYEFQRIGLGEDFLLTLEDLYSKILRTPQIYQVLHKTARRKLVRRFPVWYLFCFERE